MINGNIWPYNQVINASWLAIVTLNDCEKIAMNYFAVSMCYFVSLFCFVFVEKKEMIGQ